VAKRKTKELKNRRTEEPKDVQEPRSKVKIGKRERAKQFLAKSKLWKRIKWPLIVIGGILVLFLLSVGIYSVSYAKESYKNIYVGDTDFGAKSKSEIGEILKNKSEEFLKSDFKLIYQPGNGEKKEYAIKNADIGLVFDVDKTTSVIYAVGRQNGAITNLYQQLKTMFVPYQVDAIYVINDEALRKKIAEIATEVDIPEQDFSLKYQGNGTFQLLTERKEGKRIDQQGLIDNVKLLISNVKNKEILFKSEIFKPQVSEENAKEALADANKILAAGDLQLSYSGQNFSLDSDTIAGLIAARPKKSKLGIYLISDRVKKQVDAIASAIDRPVGDAVLGIDNGKVVVSSVSQDGLALNREKSQIEIENAILARISPETSTSDPKNVSLKVNITKPEIDSAKLAEYGLKELVGTGTTSFVKSPSNRIHNINIGTTAISGALVKPGDTFSTLGRLGKIDASTGYLPELVIKNNKTLPDYGGGLCQVSTTLFRAALAAGVKITERQNHSYRVSYYEPPIGMDATIFDPSPDFQFINNYSSYIFIQGKISGTKITFEFYGTKDSRQIEIGTPVGFDYVEPPAPVEVVDNNLAPGDRQLVSHSHQGASAKFHYKISRDGEVLQEIDFLSKYVALPEIWSVGPTAPVDPNAAPAG